MANTTKKLIARPLITLDKVRKVTPREIDGKVYLFITPKKYLGCGSNLANAITNANCQTFYTGYRVVEE